MSAYVRLKMQCSCMSLGARLSVRIGEVYSAVGRVRVNTKLIRSSGLGRVIRHGWTSATCRILFQLRFWKSILFKCLNTQITHYFDCDKQPRNCTCNLFQSRLNNLNTLSQLSKVMSFNSISCSHSSFPLLARVIKLTKLPREIIYGSERIQVS